MVSAGMWNRSVFCGGAIAGLLLTGAAGCMHGPFKLGRYNPIYQDEWKKDEVYGPSIHNKLDDLDALGRAALRMKPEEQEQASRELLERFVEEPSSQLAARMVRTAALFTSPTSSELLRQASRHSSHSVRIASCDAWAKRASPEGLEILANMVGSDSELDVRIAATRALGKFKDPLAIRALGTALEDNDPALQYRAVQSLKTVTGKDYGDSVPAWREFVQDGQATPEQNGALAE